MSSSLYGYFLDLREEFSHKLLLGDLEWWTNDEDIKKAYARRLVDVTEVKILADLSNGCSLGICVVSFDTEPMLHRALRKVPILRKPHKEPRVCEFTYENFFALMEEAQRKGKMRPMTPTEAQRVNMSSSWLTPPQEAARVWESSYYLESYRRSRESELAERKRLYQQEQEYRRLKSIASVATKRSVVHMVDGNNREGERVLKAALELIEESSLTADHRCLTIKQSLRDMLKSTRMPSNVKSDRTGKPLNEDRRDNRLKSQIYHAPRDPRRKSDRPLKRKRES